MVEKEKVKAKIIEKASEIFRRYGYKKTTMDDIAKSLKKGKSSLYYYFSSKDEIYKAVISAEGIRFRKKIFQAILTAKTPEEKVKSYILTRMNTYAETSNFHNAMKSTGMAEQEFIDRVKHIYEHQEIGLFKNILKQGIEQKYFKIFDIDLAATAIIMAMRGMEDKLFNRDSTTKYLGRLDDIVQIIFYGIVNH
jgi:AcrR family transcriptional regulator